MQKKVQVSINAAIALAVFCILFGVIVARVLNTLVDIKREIAELRNDLKLTKIRKRNEK